MISLIRMVKRLVAAIRLELYARQRFKGEARKSFKEWSKRVKQVDQLSPKEQKEWYEEQQAQWQDYYDQLL